MKTRQLLFDLKSEVKARDKGMKRATEGKQDVLSLARKIAKDVARSRPDRCCTADDVQGELALLGYSSTELGNAAGSIFRGDRRWEWTGRWVPSERIGRHANAIRVWRLRHGAD